MTTIAVALPSRPYSAILTGCARCGITVNELSADQLPSDDTPPLLRRKT